MGNVLLLLAQRYPTLLKVLLELVQNVCDVQANNAELTIDLKRRRVVCRDDGVGVTNAQFLEALAEIGKSQKPSVDKTTGRRPLGEFGLGLISPLGKCERFFFISRPSSKKSGFMEWAFATDELRSATREAPIPMHPRPDLDAQCWVALPWNTMTKIEKLVSDATITSLTLDELVREIIDAFGNRIRENGLNLRLSFTDKDGVTETCTVNPPEFAGESLPVWKESLPRCGIVRCTLFFRPTRAPTTKLALRVGTAGSDFRIAWRNFLRRHSDRLSEDVLAVLGSGFFEGEILVEKCSLLPERNGFAEDDALTAFFSLLDRWCTAVGTPILQGHRERQSFQHYQELGETVLRMLDTMIRETGLFKEVITGIRGSISERHTEFPGKQLPGTYTTPRTIGTAKPTGEGEPRERPERTKPSILHLAARGPKGHTRVSVRSESGLCVSFEALTATSRRWIFDEPTGTLRINIKHPDYNACERCGEKAERVYQELIVTWMLTVYSRPDYTRQQLIAAESTFFQAQVWRLCHSEGPPRAPRKKTRTR
jgi:hypothetical protein